MSKRKVRLLVVDDSVYMQMAIRAMLALDPDIELVGEAGDGALAIEMARTLRPDVITMDVNMPGIDGLEATRRIMSEAPTSIVMLSSMTEKGATATFRALELGAVDYIPKTASPLDVDLSTIAVQVIGKIRFWGEHHGGAAPSAPEQLAEIPVETDLLAIAAGAGGPKLVSELLRAVSPLPFPVLIAQDMPPSFTAAFVHYLARSTGLAIKESSDGAPVVTDAVTVVPGGRTWRLRRESDARLVVGLNSATAPGAPDDALTSVFTAARAPLVILLSGDGRQFVNATSAWTPKNGAIWAQHPETCVVPDLPKLAIAKGCPVTLLEPAALMRALGRAARRCAA